MPDKRITELDAASALALEDVLPVVTDPSGSPVTEKITLEQLRNLLDLDEVYHRLDGTPHAHDDEFDAATLDPSWTQVLGTTFTAPTSLVSRSALNINFSGATGGDTSAEACAYLKPISGSVGACTIEASANMLITTSFQAGVALIMTDGTNPATSNVAMVGLRCFTNEIRLSTWHGTLDALTNSAISFGRFSANDKIKMRMDWASANTFAPSWSLNGAQWTNAGLSDISKTMTPTHYGLAFSWGNGSPALVNFDYFRKVA